MNIWFIDDNYSEPMSRLKRDGLYGEYPFTFYFTNKITAEGAPIFLDVDNREVNSMSLSKVDFLVLDYRLEERPGGMTGTQALRILRRSGLTAPVLLYTSYRIEAADSELEADERDVVRKLRVEFDELFEDHRIRGYLVKEHGSIRPLLDRLVSELEGTGQVEIRRFPEIVEAPKGPSAERDWMGFLKGVAACSLVLPGSSELDAPTRIVKESSSRLISRDPVESVPLRMQLVIADRKEVVSAAKPVLQEAQLPGLEGSSLPPPQQVAARWILARLVESERRASQYRHHEAAYVEIRDDATYLHVHFAVETPTYMDRHLLYLELIRQRLSALKEPAPPGLTVELDRFVAEKIDSDKEYYFFSLALRGAPLPTPERVCYNLCEDLALLVRPVFQELYLCDILGPRMVGPSSSHTAGANRLGHLFRKTFEGFLEAHPAKRGTWHAAAHLHQSFRDTGIGHGTPSAFCGGFLGDLGESEPKIADWPVEPDQTFQVADHTTVVWHGFVQSDPGRGRDLPPLPGMPEPYHENSVALYLWAGKGGPAPQLLLECGPLTADLFFVGESWGGGNIQIRYLGGPLVRPFLADSKTPPPRDFLELGENDDRYVFVKTDRRAFSGKDEQSYPWRVAPIYTYPTLLIRQASLGQIEAKRPQRPPFDDLDDLVSYCRRTRVPIAHAARQYEAYRLGFPLDDTLTERVIDREIGQSLDLWATIVKERLDLSRIPSTLQNSETDNYLRCYHAAETATLLGQDKLLGRTACRAAELALKIMIRNSLHQTIVAAPTGGACGMVPGVLFALDEEHGFSRSVKIDALLTAALVGLVIHSHVPTSGAAMGCQAETGVGAAMAAAIAAQLLGGDAECILHAATLALKNSLGLVCDPVAGRVSTPCIKRNAFKAVEALLAAWMTLHGARSFISPAQVVRAAAAIGRDIDVKYRETSRGGLAQTLGGIDATRCSGCAAFCLCG